MQEAVGLDKLGLQPVKVTLENTVQIQNSWFGGDVLREREHGRGKCSQERNLF